MVLIGGYVYVAWRLTSTEEARLALAVPFVLVWIIPMVYWIGGRERARAADEIVHGVAYTSLAWINFLVLLSLLRDILLFVTSAAPGLTTVQGMLSDSGTAGVLVGSVAVVAVSAATVFRGPRVRNVDIPVADLPADLDGFRIVQISDLHIGPTMRGAYVRRVVDRTRELAPDLIAL